jgi:hypothetical protein
LRLLLSCVCCLKVSLPGVSTVEYSVVSILMSAASEAEEEGRRRETKELVGRMAER